MWIVKLGGSLHDAPVLRDRLAELAEVSGPPRVAVPGGGPFADSVRALQPKLGIDDGAAHRMAILAMQQFGLMLHALEPRLALAETDAELQSAHAAVWLPWHLAGHDPTIPGRWEVTSDSLACWLAIRLSAARLTLVKSAEIARLPPEPVLWARAGIVDPAFPDFAAQFGGRIELAHRDQPLTSGGG